MDSTLASLIQAPQRKVAPKTECDPEARPLGTIVIMRGISGSGKTTLAKTIRAHTIRKYGAASIVSTDDYFMGPDGKYNYDSTKVVEAHNFCKKTFQDLMEHLVEQKRRSVIIVDNTNLQPWEAKLYYEEARKHSYDFEIVEPSTSWKLDPHVCAQKTTHGVPLKNISAMRVKYFAYTVDDVKCSVLPKWAAGTAVPQRNWKGSSGSNSPGINKSKNQRSKPASLPHSGVDLNPSLLAKAQSVCTISLDGPDLCDVSATEGESTAVCSGGESCLHCDSTKSKIAPVVSDTAGSKDESLPRDTIRSATSSANFIPGSKLAKYQGKKQ